MDTRTEQNLAASMTSDTPDIIPFLPYLLQDFCELGSSPDDMVGLLSEHVAASERNTALDLGCGKGVIAVALARRLGMRVKGIDAIPEFVEEAREAAAREGVAHLCAFEVGDITVEAPLESEYDCAVYGAVGPALGAPMDMLATMRKTLRTGGYLLLDDAYAEEGDPNASYPTRSSWNEMFDKAGFETIASLSSTDTAADYDEEIDRIARRVAELQASHPGHVELFERYLDAQKGEYDELLHEIVGVTWLLKAV